MRARHAGVRWVMRLWEVALKGRPETGTRPGRQAPRARPVPRVSRLRVRMTAALPGAVPPQGAALRICTGVARGGSPGAGGRPGAGPSADVPLPAQGGASSRCSGRAGTSGGCWIGCFRSRPPSGPVPNLWEAQVCIHGWAAVGGVFLLGWLGGGTSASAGAVRAIAHPATSCPWSRPCGCSPATRCVTPRLHDLAAVAHEVLGAAALFIAVAHWQRRWRRRSARCPRTCWILSGRGSLLLAQRELRPHR